MISVPSVNRPTGLRLLAIVSAALGALVILAVLVWQGATSAGSPDPTAPHNSSPAATLDVAVLVFREGLECILVLTAITAGLLGANKSFRKPIGIGVIAGFIATLITWFVAVRIIDDLAENIPALAVQAATGLLAILVLLVVMNWFFHKVYWTGWISLHNRRKKSLLQNADDPGTSKARLLWGLGLLGFTSLYREGFEVVLFLQSYRLRLGEGIVFYGALLGLIFCGIIAVLNFVAHHKLPYKKMLTITGVMLTAVLFVMVGEEVFEMQQAGWIGTTDISWLQWLPSWAGTWLSIFPNWETVIAQGVAVVLVLGSYGLARYQAVLLPKKNGLAPFEQRETPPTDVQRSLTAPTH
ncbi:MAG TPA: FTR1 family protein [Chloroflexia bacterium]|nr:FTR1 family protein [Chloroflexia bacterium]